MENVLKKSPAKIEPLMSLLVWSTTVRNILDKMIYNDEYTCVAKNMGHFQVGNQKGRNIRDHAFVLHAICNDCLLYTSDAADE